MCFAFRVSRFACEDARAHCPAPPRNPWPIPLLGCLELCGRHRTKETLAAGDWILRHMRDGTLLKMQERDGSWSEGRGNEARAGACYSTSMAVLALTPAYRQLPIYQR